ncbi:MAG: beta-propeller domain-containing protein [Acidimicrobiales bacterium]
MRSGRGTYDDSSESGDGRAPSAGRAGQTRSAARRITRRRRPAWTGAALGTALVLSACSAGSGPSGGPGEQAAGAPKANPNLGVDVALEPTESCDALLGYLHQQTIDHLGEPGYPGGQQYATGSGGSFTGPPTTLVAPSARSQNDSTAGAADKSAPASSEASGSAAAGAADEAPAHSETNNQEKGVDEADLTKTDGKRLFGIVDGDVVAWDLTGASPRQTDRLRLETGGESQLLLAGDRLLVITTSGSTSYPEPMPVIEDAEGSSSSSGGSGSSGTTGTSPDHPRPALREGPVTVLTQIDVSNVDDLRVQKRVALEGTVAGARSIGGTARLAVSTPAPDLPLVYGSSRRAQDAAKEANKAIIEKTTIDEWLPQWVDLGTSGIPDPASLEGHPLLRCEDVNRPKHAAGVGMVSLLTVDLGGSLEPGNGVGVVGAGETVYASASNLYVTTTEYADGTSGSNSVATPTVARTAVHKFGIEGGTPATYRASGGVAGHLLNQFSMSEDGEALRLATTVDSINTGRSGAQSQVVVLSERDGELKQVGAVGGLGKGEQIKAVRFLGKVGYVVTFRQTDPLYTVDLSDPTHPEVAGELKILGYSAYLHPAGDGLLIGVGQDATATGRTTGTQVALYDVSKPADPKQLQKYVLPGSTTSAESEHHAFTWWPATNLAILPVTTNGSTRTVPTCMPDADCATAGGATRAQPAGFVGALGLKITRDGISEVGRIINPVDGVAAFGPSTASTTTSSTSTTKPTPGSTSTTTGPSSTVPSTPSTTADGPVPSTTIPCDPACPKPGADEGAAPVTTTTVDPAVREAARLSGNCDVNGSCPPAPGMPIAPNTTTTIMRCDPACPPPSPLPTTPKGGVDYSGAGAPILRIVVVGDQVLTLSETGLRTGHLDDLTFVAWEPLK